MEYQEFLETKRKDIIESGFEVETLNENLFQFQEFIVRRALKAGKYAIFADTGLGKTIMQLSWANQVRNHTKKPVLILAPLAVTGQTIEEGEKFGIKVWKYDGRSLMRDIKEHEYLDRIVITNYEQLPNIDQNSFAGIVLDESSILKNYDGKYRTMLTEMFSHTPYKLACTATPSPNDPMELGNHAEFLDVMKYSEMLAMYFVNDTKDTGHWRIKGHAVSKFYEFVSTWSIMLNKPGENEVPIQLKDKRFTSYVPMYDEDPFPRTPEGFTEFFGFDPESKYDREEQYSHLVWQRYASPVWMDVSQTNVLQYTTARGENDEKHICPLQLDVIERLILLYSNEGETIFSPFGGIGSEGYKALRMGRKSISIELKQSYFDTNVKNHRNAVEQNGQLEMF